MYGSVKKETYELESLQISPDTIRSIKTVEDTVKTEQEENGPHLKLRLSISFPKMLRRIRQAIATSIFDF